MDANHQSRSLPALHDVTLNIGLGVGKFPARPTLAHRLSVWTKTLPQIMLPGYMASLVLVPRHVYKQEPLLIVQGTFDDAVNQHDLLWQAVEQSEQDCIAIYRHDDYGSGRGFLFGPNVEAWGEFNINLFSFIGDSHE